MPIGDSALRQALVDSTRELVGATSVASEIHARCHLQIDRRPHASGDSPSHEAARFCPGTRSPGWGGVAAFRTNRKDAKDAREP